MALSKAELTKVSLRANVIESAANTFTETSFSTNLAVRGDHLFIITAMAYDISADLNSNAEEIRLQVTYATQSAIIRPDDPDYLFGIGFRAQVVTSGAGIWQRTNYQPVNHFPIAVPTLYLGVKGSGLAAATQIGVKLEGYHQKVSTTDYFRLAQSR